MLLQLNQLCSNFLLTFVNAFSNQKKGWSLWKQLKQYLVNCLSSYHEQLLTYLSRITYLILSCTFSKNKINRGAVYENKREPI